MKAAEIADAMIAAITTGNYRALRCNFANGDMVGHTGNFRALRRWRWKPSTSRSAACWRRSTRPVVWH